MPSDLTSEPHIGPSGSPAAPDRPHRARWSVQDAGYRLVPAVPVVLEPPVLDEWQRQVVSHPGGPLLVLAGPGTGKTTTLVESVVDRIRRGADPASVLVLTFSRRAAADVRRRIVARLGQSMASPRAMTFHAFCHSLVRRFGNREVYGPNLRLLTAPEQDFRVRELMDGTGVDWPDSLAAARPTHAFAAEVRAVLTRARQLGMDPDDLVEAGRAAGREEWMSVGEFFAEYLDVTDAEEVFDYAELVHRSRLLLTEPEVLAAVRHEVGCVFVDEYQDTDAAQVELLHALVPPGGDLVVVGDPDQSIYAFRGAEPRGIFDFPDRFRTAAGEPAPVRALGCTRRFGPVLAAATRRISSRLPLPRRLPTPLSQPTGPTVPTGLTPPTTRCQDRPATTFAALERFRSPEPAADVPRGRVEVLTCTTAGAEAEHIAELLRAAHLHDDLPWSQMAVLVRSGRRAIPGLSRALVAAGVPVEVAGDEIPLSAELAVRPLLLAIQVAARGRRPDADEAARLLTSPLGGLDSLGLRRLGRTLREAERAELGGLGPPRLSNDLIPRALSDPSLLDECTATDEVGQARNLAELLTRVERLIGARASAADALWELWSATGWPTRLQSDAAQGGDAGRRADRDLDAVCALFDVAAQSEEKAGHKGVTSFLADVEGQQIPADTRREGDVRGSGVRVLTAHRSKGLEWPLVVVAGVQEGVWPDLRHRSSVLEPDRLSLHGVVGPESVGARIAEERRLFYVACTRATRRLVVTAVEGTEGENDQPSRFLAELGVAARALPGRPRRPLSLAGLVGELRAASVDPAAPPALREAAAARLARLADATDDLGRPLAGAADPDRWWGMNESTNAPAPVVAGNQRVRLSGSQLAGLLGCPRSWFLARKANGEPARNTAASFGSVVHVLVEHAARQSIAGSTHPTELLDHLDRIWDQLDFDANWLSAVERVEAESALERYAMWAGGRHDREVLGVEVGFSTVVDCGQEQVEVTGSADRVERDGLGRIHVVDFKTGRRAPSAGDVASMDQLGVYQLAVRQGALAEVTGPEPVLGGAELVFLRLAAGAGSPYPKVFVQPSLEEVPQLPWSSGASRPGPAAYTRPEWPTWVHGRLAEAAAVVRSEQFEARVGPACSYCPFRSSCPAQGAGRQVVG